MKLNNRIKILILRHPQEIDRRLGTAQLVAETLTQVQIVTGLSWPNFEKALGEKNPTEKVDPKKWGVLYLGSLQLPEGRKIGVYDKKNNLIFDDAAIIANLEGLVVLDGTWSQAKALWWRNPWMLKLQRLVIAPFMPSLYGKLRREPRKESVSTLEAIANALVALGEPVELSKALVTNFRKMLDEYRAELAQSKPR